MVLVVGSSLSGLLAYVFFIIVARTLGPERAAPVSVLWTLWAFAGAALTFPFQHWVARTVAAQGGERPVRDGLRGVATLVVPIAVVATIAAWFARHLLFHNQGPWFPLLVGGVVIGAALIGLTRGVLTARGRFGGVAAGLVAENAIRCLVAGVLAVSGVGEPLWYGVALLAGYLVAGLFPSVFRLRATGTSGASSSTRSVAEFVGGAAGSQLIGTATLTGGPVLLALSGGSAHQITSLFAGLALFRAPYMLALGVVAQMTAMLTRLVVARRVDRLRRLERLVAVGTLVGVLGAAVVGWFLGPPLVRVVFGQDVDLGPGIALVLAVATTFAMANLTVALMVLAQNRGPALVRAWSIAVVPGALWFALAPTSALERTCGAFLVIEMAAFVLLLVEAARGTSALEAASS